MNIVKKNIYLIRHSETAWSLSGQHTGRTDIPLTKQGEEDAAHMGKTLSAHTFTTILCSPLKRAKDTCKIAGFQTWAQEDPDLMEWNYGDYEGLTTEQIWKKCPAWNIFSNGAPGGETPADVTLRANKILNKIQSSQGDVALFSHGHFLRALAAIWLNLPIEEGRYFALTPASISILGFERQTHVIALWNLSKAQF